ncbi:MAG: glycoside hydrolase family 92 protein [Armatimonadetes bacterium]|nr:glycoside hydrolase family 92 protein [Akkermansiaceae bacterium]
MKKTALWIIPALALTVSQANAQESHTSYVRPMIGTSGHGHVFPGASVPFGMVQLSPDTGNEGWDWCSGYHYSDSSIMGFSHTHISGSGRGDLLDVLLMPTTGKIQLDPGSKANPDEGYRSRFSHERETAKAGYYAVHLDDYDVKAELTASPRAGFHRYTFEEKGQGNVVIDMAHSFKTDQILDGSIQIKEENLVVGSHKSKGWAEGNEKDFVEHEVFFAARFSQPITGVVFQTDGSINDQIRKSTGKSVKAGLTFDVSPEKPLLVKVGISGVDLDGALRNLDAEIPDWDFDKIAANSIKQWNETLGRFEVKDNDESAKETFYTAVYRACLAPYTANDVDGRYMGSDHKIQKADGYTNMTGLSLWDTFRAANPLYTLIAPKVTSDIVQSMLAQHDEYGLLPVWSLCNSETNCMIGYHSIPVIVDAYLKGIPGFDAEKAFTAMKKSAMQDDFAIKHLKAYNYIPRDLTEHTSVAMTLEYAFDDYCIAVMAEKLGKKEDHAYFTKRSQAFKNVYDTSIGFMRGKDSKGEFRKDFDPYNAVNATSDFIEGNSWQYTWFVPHDIPTLIAGMGGKEPFVKRLDELFSVSSKLDKDTPKDVSGLIGQYAHGNEPSHHVAYLFNWGDTPWKTQERVSQICRELYSNKPDGLCGNEDMGQMSAWYVFSALGFYPVNPVDGKYVFGTPVFDEVLMNLPNGKKFAVKATGLSKKNIYIKQVLLNGKSYQKGHITHANILDGGEIEFIMSDKPGMVFQMD